MTIIYIRPKDINLRQLEQELGVAGLHVSTIGDSMLVEADADEDLLAAAVEAHEADPMFKHPDDVKARGGDSQTETAKKDAARKSAVAKLKAIGLTDDEIAAL